MYHILVNRRDGRGWRLLNDDYDVAYGYRTFIYANKDRFELARDNPSFAFKIMQFEVID